MSRLHLPSHHFVFRRTRICFPGLSDTDNMRHTDFITWSWSAAVLAPQSIRQQLIQSYDDDDIKFACLSYSCHITGTWPCFAQQVSLKSKTQFIFMQATFYVRSVCYFHWGFVGAGQAHVYVLCSLASPSDCSRPSAQTARRVLQSWHQKHPLSSWTSSMFFAAALAGPRTALDWRRTFHLLGLVMNTVQTHTGIYSQNAHHIKVIFTVGHQALAMESSRHKHLSYSLKC